MEKAIKTKKKGLKSLFFTEKMTVFQTATLACVALIAVAMSVISVAFNFLSVISFKGDGTVLVLNFDSKSISGLTVTSLILAIASAAALVLAIVFMNSKKGKLFETLTASAVGGAFVSSLLYMIAGMIARGQLEGENVGGSSFGMFIAIACVGVIYLVLLFMFSSTKRAWFVKYIVNTFDKWKGWIYLSPALILLLVFTVWPIFNTVRLAFLEGYNSMDAVTGKTFEFGFGNFTKVVMGSQTEIFKNGQYITVFVESDFPTALFNTVLLCLVTVPLSTILALLIAVCLNAIKPLQRLFQTIFFLPYVTNSIAIGMVFMAMFNMVIPNANSDPTNIGIINTILGVFGIDPINWVNGATNPDFPMNTIANYAVVIIYIVWNALPFKILILLGGLQSVSKQYYDAAKIDATPRRRVFTRITVPLLSPMIAYVVITGFIGGFKEYSSIVGIFGETMGPPITGTASTVPPLQTMVGMIYDAIKDDGLKYYGEASAAALILFGIIFVVTMVNLYVSKKKTHY